MFLIDTYLDKSKIQGVGVFAKENVKKGEKISQIELSTIFLI
jgi:SET domain-containing protein